MPPKHGGGAGGAGATIKGKQSSVHEGQFLQFLRSVGYRDELPPSTVAWLESAPVFRFLASKLSHDNFVSAEEEQEYNELMLARGPDASLYDAVDALGSDVDSDSCMTAATSTRAAAQRESDPFLAEASEEEVARMLEAEEAYAQALEQQVSALRTASDALDCTNRQQAETQGALHFGLTARAADDLSAAKLDAGQFAESLDDTLADLEAVCRELCSLAGQPQLWLLCAADQAGYKQMDDHINTQHLRGVQVLDVCDVALDLHHPSSPTTLDPLALAAAKAAGSQALAAAAGRGGLSTPRGSGQQQQQDGLTPRQHVQGQSLADALKEAKTKRRAAHAARNEALNREMSRQQHAFLLAYQRDVAAGLKEQGLRAELAAVQQVRSRSGEFAALLGKGPSAVQELQQQVRDAEAVMMLLKHSSLKHLIQEVADLNDCHIVVGDYDRHLAKVNYAMDRKRAMLDSLMSRASLHLVLLLLCVEELRRLSTLSGQLRGTAGVLEGHIAATEARMQRCAAALEALNKAQGLGNVQAADSYLCALLAAADGTLLLPGREQRQQPDPAVAAGARDPATPAGLQRAPQSSVAGGLFTPSYAPTSSLVDKLQALADGLDGSTEQLHKLLDLLPAQMDQHKASAVRLHRTAFPHGQPMHAAAAGALSGLSAEHPGGGGSSVAGSVRAGSVAGSARGGSVAGASSLRSDGSVSAALSQHPQLLLTLPEVAEASAAVKGCLEQLQHDANRAITKQNEAVRVMGRSKEKLLERQVMAKFFTAPQELAADVDAVKAQVQQMRLGSLLSF